MRRILLGLLLAAAGAYGQDAPQPGKTDSVRTPDAASAPLSGDEAADIIAAAPPAVSAPASVPADTLQTLREVRDLKIGFVNFRRIMLEIPQFTDMRSTLDNEFRADNERLLSERERLANMESELGRMARDDAYIAFEKQVIAKRREVARQEAAFRDAHSVRRNEEMAKLQTVVADEIVRLAKEEGFDIILNDIGVVYVSEEADLTGTVILRLQTRNR